MEAAGGIGGLLAISDPCDPADTVGDFVYTYDANGNVGELIDGTPTMNTLLTQQWHREDRSP